MPDRILGGNGHRAEGSKQSLCFDRVTGMTETDERTTIWRQVECRLKRIRRFDHDVAEQSQDCSCLLIGVVDVAGCDGPNRMETKVERCRDAKIGARTLESPQ